jgi:hypothetical protein
MERERHSEDDFFARARTAMAHLARVMGFAAPGSQLALKSN